jgi:hypothetical protein
MLPVSQVGFFNVVILPLFQAFTTHFPGALQLLENARTNFAHWQSKPWPASG